MMRAIVIAVLAIIAGIVAAQAQPQTCEDVKALSPSKRAYWAKIYGLSAEQRRTIREQCGLTSGRRIVKRD